MWTRDVPRRTITAAWSSSRTCTSLATPSRPGSDGRRASEGEDDQAEDAGADAVEAERGEAAGLEVAEQEFDRGPGGDRGGDRADQRLAADAVAGRAEEFGQLQHPGGADHRRRQQEGVAGGVLVGEPGEEAAAPRHAGARDPRDQGQRLGGADAECLAKAHLG